MKAETYTFTFTDQVLFDVTDTVNVTVDSDGTVRFREKNIGSIEKKSSNPQGWRPILLPRIKAPFTGDVVCNSKQTACLFLYMHSYLVSNL